MSLIKITKQLMAYMATLIFLSHMTATSNKVQNTVSKFVTDKQSDIVRKHTRRNTSFSADDRPRWNHSCTFGGLFFCSRRRISAWRVLRVHSLVTELPEVAAAGATMTSSVRPRPSGSVGHTAPVSASNGFNA